MNPDDAQKSISWRQVLVAIEIPQGLQAERSGRAAYSIIRREGHTEQWYIYKA
jgi:hypothetical protein